MCPAREASHEAMRLLLLPVRLLLLPVRLLLLGEASLAGLPYMSCVAMSCARVPLSIALEFRRPSPFVWSHRPWSVWGVVVSSLRRSRGLCAAGCPSTRTSIIDLNFIEWGRVTFFPPRRCAIVSYCLRGRRSQVKGRGHHSDH